MALAISELVESHNLDRSRIELWHQAVDGGPSGDRLMDWPCTESYCRATAAALGFPIRFQWKDGRFVGELLRDNAPTSGVYYEAVDGDTRFLPPQGRKRATRRKFPAKSADLQTRWCSGYLKIDVARRAINNDPRFEHANILFLTGERRQECAARSKYKECEPTLKATSNHLVALCSLGFLGVEVDAIVHDGIFSPFKVSQPVASGLATSAATGGCYGLLAGVQDIVVKELRRAAPEVEFIEVAVLLPGLTGHGNAAADFLGKFRRQFDDGVIAVAIEVFVRAMGIEDKVHEKAPKGGSQNARQRAGRSLAPPLDCLERRTGTARTAFP